MGSASSESFDVIICGFGPSGAAAASLLGQRGARVLVVERHSGIAGFPRAVHFDGEVMRIFQSLGLAEAMQSFTQPASGVRYINRRGATLISADFIDEPVRHGWPRGHYFSQPELDAVLRRSATACASVIARLGWEVVAFRRAGHEVRVDVRETAGGATETLSAQYLLACDGASSGLRSQLGVKLRQLGPPSTWLVCDTRVEREIAGHHPMYQVCDPVRPVTVEPCGGRNARWEFRVLPGDPKETLESEDFAMSLLKPYLHLVAPDLQPSAVRVLRSKVYTFRSAVAPRWRIGRVFLLGDAAHLMPPFLGQGMCAGIRDAFNLCWKLAGVLHDGHSDALLDTYQSERLPHVTAVIRDAADIAVAIQAGNPLSAWLRDTYLRLRSSLPFLARPMAREASWSLGPGLFDDDGNRTPAADRRNLFDQATVRMPAGETVRLDDLLGHGFALLFLGVDPETVLDSGQHAAWVKLGARIVRIGPAASPAAAAGAVRDPSGILDRWRARVGGVDVAVVRPDRQVFGRYQGSPAVLSDRLEAARRRLTAGLGPFRRSGADA